jgi:hypothetical protein
MYSTFYCNLLLLSFAGPLGLCGVKAVLRLVRICLFVSGLRSVASTCFLSLLCKCNLRYLRTVSFCCESSILILKGAVLHVWKDYDTHRLQPFTQ